MSSLVESICSGFDVTVHAPMQKAPQQKLDACLFGSYETAKPVEVVEGPNRTNKCLYCSPAAKCMLDEDTDGVWIAQCGIVHTHFASEDMSARTFQGDTTQDKDKKTHTSVVTDDERRQLVHILPEHIPGATAHVLWMANTRLNQCTVWLKFVRNEDPGTFWLTEGEVKRARIALKAAATQWARQGGEDAAFGSPIFWTIGIIMEMVAQRFTGYTMPTQAQCNLVSLEGLHAYFAKYQSHAVVTEESEFSATRARGAGTVGQAAVNQVTRRKARFDPLGGGCQSKMATLSGFLVKSHVWPNPNPDAPEEEKWLGLSAPVTALQQPVLRERAPNEPAGEPIFLKVRKVYNTPADVITARKAAEKKALDASKAEAAANTEAAAAAAAAVAAADDGSDSDAEMLAKVSGWDEKIARRRGAGPAFGAAMAKPLGGGLRAQVSCARGRTQAGPKQDGPFLCPTPFVPNASVPSVARTNLTRTTPIRTWCRQSRLARLPRPARAARRGLARRLLQPT